MKKFTFIFLLSVVSVCYAQDPPFTNLQQSLVSLNPSFCGSNGFIRNQSAFRNQWSTDLRFITFNNSFDAFIKPVRGGIGLSYTRNDNARGVFTDDKISFAYAQYFYLFNKKLQIVPSIQFSYVQNRIDYSKIHFSGDDYLPSTTQSLPNKKQYVDFSSGLLLSYKHFYFGTSVFHINQPNHGFSGVSKLPYSLVFFSSYNLAISEKSKLNFIVRIGKQQMLSNSQLGVSGLFFNHLIVGTGVQSGGIYPYFNLGYRNNYFTLQASYQLFFDSYSNFNAYEFTASLNFRTKELRKTLTDFEKW